MSIRNLLILAILLRLAVAPFYFHPDIKTYHFQASFLKEGVWNIYTYLENNRERLPFKEEFVYFPLTYFFLGSYQVLISPLLGADFINWLSDATGQANQSLGVYRYLFLLKLPYLAIDISIAFLLMLFFTSINDKKKVFVLWLFNPISIALVYIYSNVDIIPVFLTVVSLLFAKKNKLILSALFLGLAASFKGYPLLFLPFLLLYAKNIKQATIMLFATAGVFAAIISPFWSPAFQNSALISGLTTRIVSFGLSIGFGQILLVPVLAIAGLFFYAILRKDKDILYYYVALLLLIFSFIHFHIQWLLWIIPFLTILFLVREKLTGVVISLISLAFIIPLLYEDKSMTVGLLSVISPLFNLIPIPFAAVLRIYDPYVLQSVLHSIFAGGSLIFIRYLFEEKKS